MKLILTILFVFPLFSFGQDAEWTKTINENYNAYPRLELTPDGLTAAQYDSLSKLKVGWNWKPTKYKRGYTFTVPKDPKGFKRQLLEWVKMIGSSGLQEYTWKVKVTCDFCTKSAIDYMQDSEIQEGRPIR